MSGDQNKFRKWAKAVKLYLMAGTVLLERGQAMFEEADDEDDEHEHDLIASLTQDDFLVLERGA